MRFEPAPCNPNLPVRPKSAGLHRAVAGAMQPGAAVSAGATGTSSATARRKAPNDRSDPAPGVRASPRAALEPGDVRDPDRRPGSDPHPVRQDHGSDKQRNGNGLVQDRQINVRHAEQGCDSERRLDKNQSGQHGGGSLYLP